MKIKAKQVYENKSFSWLKQVYKNKSFRWLKQVFENKNFMFCAINGHNK